MGLPLTRAGEKYPTKKRPAFHGRGDSLRFKLRSRLGFGSRRPPGNRRDLSVRRIVSRDELAVVGNLDPSALAHLVELTSGSAMLEKWTRPAPGKRHVLPCKQGAQPQPRALPCPAKNGL